MTTRRSSARKAKQPELTRKMRVDDAVALVIRECLEHWTANEAIALRGVDPEGIHEMRVGLRRMRSALSDFKTIIPTAQLVWMRRESRWLITSLSAARDWDVFLAELLQPVEAARQDDTRLKELRKTSVAEKKKGYATVQEAIRSSRYLKFIAQMRHWLSARSRRLGNERQKPLLDQPIGRFARQVLNKRHKVVLKLGRDFAGLSTVERHKLRIGLKKLRYTADFFRVLYSKRFAKPYFQALAGMQDCLGHMNDVVVAEHLLDRLLSAPENHRVFARLAIASGVVVGWHAHGANLSAQEAEANWRHFCDRGVFW